jgi:hypothetical protein
MVNTSGSTVIEKSLYGGGLQPREAVESHQGARLGHSRVDACKGAVVVTIIPVFAANAHLFRQLTVVRCYDTSLAGNEQLGRAQTVHVSMRLTAHRHTLVQSTKAMSSVEYQLETMAIGNRLQCLDMSWIAKVVHGDNAARCGGNGSFSG